jgi:hypothetical protein
MKHKFLKIVSTYIFEYKVHVFLHGIHVNSETQRIDLYWIRDGVDYISLSKTEFFTSFGSGIGTQFAQMDIVQAAWGSRVL